MKLSVIVPFSLLIMSCVHTKDTNETYFPDKGMDNFFLADIKTTVAKARVGDRVYSFKDADEYQMNDKSLVNVKSCSDRFFNLNTEPNLPEREMNRYFATKEMCRIIDILANSKPPRTSNNTCRISKNFPLKNISSASNFIVSPSPKYPAIMKQLNFKEDEISPLMIEVIGDDNDYAYVRPLAFTDINGDGIGETIFISETFIKNASFQSERIVAIILDGANCKVTIL